MATINAINSNIPIEVTKGGTGAVTLTDHGVLVGSGTAAIDALAVGATGTVLQGTTGADPDFTATPSVTSITLSGGSALSSFVNWTSWTPTVVGGTTAGATTYTTQSGQYMRIGNVVIAQWIVSYSAATGTGDIVIGGLPLTIANVGGNVPYGTVVLSSAGTAWPAGRTYLTAVGTTNATTMTISANGTAVAGANVQLANTAATIRGTLEYRV